MEQNRRIVQHLDKTSFFLLRLDTFEVIIKHMIKKIINLGAIIGTLIVSFSMLSSSNGPGGNKTGAPGSSGNCSACHGNTPNTAGIIRVKLIDNGTEVTTYTPGKTYDLELNILGSNEKIGFQLSVINDQNKAAGTISNNSSGTQVYISGSQQIWGHNTPGTGTWTAKWTAPDANTGSVIFYVAAVFADGNGQNSGDYFNTFNVEINEESSNSNHTLFKSHNELIENPVKDQLKLQHSVASAYIWNSEGKLIGKFFNSNQFEVNNIAPGVYHLNYVNENGSTGFIRFVKQ